MERKITLEKLRIKRITKGYSQEYMAQKLKITQSQYSRLEGGVNKISEKQSAQIFQILNIVIV